MIKVVFAVEPNTDCYAWLESCRKHMDWLNYLYENSYDLILHQHYEEAAYQTIVRYCFYLTPEKETFYRLKYPD